MVLGRDMAAAALGLVYLLGSAPRGARSFPLPAPPSTRVVDPKAATTAARPRRIMTTRESGSSSSSSSSSGSSSSSSSSSTSLSNMLRDYASDGGYYYGNGYYGQGYPSGNNSNDSSYRSSDWRRNQGYNLDRPTPPELGGTPYDYRRLDAETNPYYDPGWAQSVRRDSPAMSSSYVDRRLRGYYNSYTGIESVASGTPPVTYPGMADPRRTDKVYTNPTNPYYDPVWSQSYVRNDEPIREGDHTAHYAPGYDVQNRNYYLQQGGMMGGGYGYRGDGGGRMGMMGGGGGGGGGMMMDDGYYDVDYPRRGGGGGGGGRMGGGMYAAAAPSSRRTKAAAINGNSLMR